MYEPTAHTGTLCWCLRRLSSFPGWLYFYGSSYVLYRLFWFEELLYMWALNMYHLHLVLFYPAVETRRGRRNALSKVLICHRDIVEGQSRLGLHGVYATALHFALGRCVEGTIRPSMLLLQKEGGCTGDMLDS